MCLGFFIFLLYCEILLYLMEIKMYLLFFNNSGMKSHNIGINSHKGWMKSHNNIGRNLIRPLPHGFNGFKQLIIIINILIKHLLKDI